MSRRGRPGRRLRKRARPLPIASGHVDPKEILFTGCATESNNTAIVGTAHGNPNRRHIITTTVEHPAVLEVCKELERNGYKVTYLSVDRDGNLDLREFIQALSPSTLLVSIMHANNETGVIFPIDQLSRITKQTDPAIVFHTDATQTVGKLPIDLVQGLPYVDLLSFSGHKLHAPKGIGRAFYAARNALPPFHAGRAPGRWPARRNRKRSVHRRPGQGAVACHGKPRKGRSPNREAARPAGKNV